MQHGNPSSHWTIGLRTQWHWLALGALTIFHLFLSEILPPAEDELYYWSWAQNLGASYYDHPPMVAYLIRLTSVFGHSWFALRVSAVVLATLSLAAISLWSDRQVTLGPVLLSPIFLFGGVLITPDLPLAFFWVLYVAWFMAANRSLSEWHGDPITRVYRQMPVPFGRWLGGGLLLGLGLLSKYTMVLAIPCGFFILILKYRPKGWFLGYLFHLLVALLVFSPVLWFSWRHQFSPFQFQWDHSMRGSGFSFSSLGNFMGGQILLLGALPFLFLPLALLKSPELYEEPRSHVALFFFSIPMLFFLFKACRGPLEANWAIVAFLSFWPIAQKILDESSFQPVLKILVGISFVPPLLASVLILVHLVHPLKWVTPEKDRVRKLSAQYELAEKVQREMPRGETLYAPTYQWTSYFKYLGMRAEQFYPEGRESQFTLEQTTNPCEKQSLVAFIEDNRWKEALSCFPHREILKTYPLNVRETTLNTFHLVRLAK